MRHRFVERLRLIALIALLFVPIAFSGHVHAGDHGAQPCAVCAVTQHTPVAHSAIAPVPAHVALVTVVAADAVVVPPVLAPRAAASRGPPALFVSPTA